MKTITTQEAAKKLNRTIQQIQPYSILMVYGDAWTPQSMWKYIAYTQKEYDERKNKLDVPTYKIV